MPTGPAVVKPQGSTRDAIRNFYETETRNAEKIQRFTLGLTEDDELPPYVHQEYPKAMYPEHEGGDPIVVQNADEEAEHLQEGYFSSLAEAKEHYAHNGNGDEDEEGGDEDEILVATESDDEAEPVHHVARKPPVKRRRRAKRQG